MNPILLIVDDEPAGRDALESVLFMQNYSLVFAANGFEALAKARELLPDLILLDVMLPGLDGYEVCRRLRADPLVAEVPIVMVTALDDRSSRLRGLEAGADDFVGKPIDREELRARVRAIVRLNRYRMLKEERVKLERQLEETTRRTQELEFLSRISAEMRKVQQRLDMMRLLVDQVVGELKAQAGAMALIEDGALFFYAVKGVVEGWHEQSLPHDDSIFWRAIDGAESIFVEADFERQIGSDRLSALLPQAISSCILSPLKSGMQITGILFVGFTGEQAFAENQKRLAATVAETAGHALQRMRATEDLHALVQSRTRELESIYKVTSAASESLDISRTFQKALELAVEAVNTPIGAIYLKNDAADCVSIIAQVGFPASYLNTFDCVDLESCPEGVVIKQNQLLVVQDLASASPCYEMLGVGEALSYTGFPLHVRDDVVGVLAMIRPRAAPFAVDEITLVSFIADHLGLIIENRRLYQQSEKNAVLEERSRLARDLHDSVTQLLYSAALFSTGTKKLLAQGKLEPAIQNLEQIEQVTQQALREMRLMVFELRAPPAMNFGLVGEIQNRLDAVERRSGISAVFHASDLPPMSPVIENTLYRVTIEALNNSLKHAFARHVDVYLHAEDGQVTLSVKDDGVGFHLDDGKRSGGLGLISMQERIEHIGGSMRIDTNPGSGTNITISLQTGEQNALPDQERYPHAP